MDLKRYELKDHLGNVRVIVSDLRHAKLDNGVPTDFTALIKHYSNYYPFGMEKPSMVWDKGGYRYGFNGKENDDEVSGVANNVDFGARMYDSRLGRWTALDPLMAKYPGMSPYNGMGNNPIYFLDPDGKDMRVSVKDGVITFSTTIHISGEGATKAKAAEMQTAIMKYWGSQHDFEYAPWFAENYKVVFDVKVDVCGDEGTTFQNGDNMVFLFDEVPTSIEENSRDVVIDGSTGYFNNKSEDYIIAHEFGHLMLIDDLYKEVDAIFEGVKVGTKSVPFDDVKEPETNIMAHRKSNVKVAQQTIDEMAKYVLSLKEKSTVLKNTEYEYYKEGYKPHKKSLFQNHCGNGRQECDPNR